MQLAQSQGVLQNYRSDDLHHHGPHILDDDRNPAAWTLNGMVRIVSGGCLDVPQDAREAKGVTALADACADKVAEADGTDTIIVANAHALLYHSHRVPAHAVIGAVKRVLVGVQLGRRTPRQNECMLGGRV